MVNDHKAVQLIQRTARLAARAAVRDSLLVSLLYALAALLALLVLHPHLTPGAAWGVLGLLVLLPALRALRAHRRALGLRAAASRLDARFGLGDQLASALDDKPGFIGGVVHPGQPDLHVGESRGHEVGRRPGRVLRRRRGGDSGLVAER